MGNIISYVEETMATFDEVPLGAVDSLVLSTLAYTCVPEEVAGARGWEGVRLIELLRAEHFGSIYARMWAPKNALRLLKAAAASPRFRNVLVCGYVDELDADAQKQFSATTYRVAPGRAYVAFRGTDNTLVGWKEDFNMAFCCPVPAQEAAARYLDEVAARVPGTLVTGGHSKGGNLAVYSAAKCGDAVRGRVERAYSHDGPGFMEAVLLDPDFVRTAGKVEKTLPQSSIVGMLLEDQENVSVVRSKSVGMLQHDPFTWDVVDGALVLLERIGADARYVDKTLQGWVASMSEEERGRLVDTVYEVINTNGDVTFEEWRADLGKTLPAVARAASRLDRETAGFLTRMLRELALMSVRSLPALFDARR